MYDPGESMVVSVGPELIAVPEHLNATLAGRGR